MADQIPAVTNAAPPTRPLGFRALQNRILAAHDALDAGALDVSSVSAKDLMRLCDLQDQARALVARIDEKVAALTDPRPVPQPTAAPIDLMNLPDL